MTYVCVVKNHQQANHLSSTCCILPFDNHSFQTNQKATDLRFSILRTLKFYVGMQKYRKSEPQLAPTLPTHSVQLFKATWVCTRELPSFLHTPAVTTWLPLIGRYVPVGSMLNFWSTDAKQKPAKASWTSGILTTPCSFKSNKILNQVMHVKLAYFRPRHQVPILGPGLQRTPLLPYCHRIIF